MRTALYKYHLESGARLVDFAGWEMPVYYKGILLEHQTVRQAVGIFDISHMGRISVVGPDAETLLSRLSSNRIANRPNFSATYAVYCSEQGGSIDDVMIYKCESAHRFYVACNASNRQKDLNHILNYANKMDVEIKDYFSGYGILALQGPKAFDLLSSLFPQTAEIKPMRFILLQNDEDEMLISRTGYTGAGGFEIFGSDSQIVKLWEILLQKGQEYGIKPIGLGARDTLRLEMGFALYGHELAEEISPIESVSAWTVKVDKEDFIGKEALIRLENSPKKRYAYGVKLLVPGIARQGCRIIRKSREIGRVTSGSFSPTLNAAIALIMVDFPLEIGDVVEVQIRQSLCQAQVVQLPFVRKQS